MLLESERRIRMAVRFAPRRALLVAGHRVAGAVFAAAVLAWGLSTWFVVGGGNDRLTVAISGGALALDWHSVVDRPVTWAFVVRPRAGGPIWYPLPIRALGEEVSTGSCSSEVCPLWMVMLPVAAAALVARGILRAIDVTARAREEGRCIWCLYDLRGNSTGTCPECGHQAASLPRPVLDTARIAAPHARPGKQFLCLNLGMVLMFLVLLMVAKGDYHTFRSWGNRFTLSLVGFLGPIGWFTHAAFGKLPTWISFGAATGLWLGANVLVWKTRLVAKSCALHMFLLLMWTFAGTAEVWFLAGNWPE